MKHISAFLRPVIILAGLFLFLSAHNILTAREIRIQVVVTSDVHGRIFPYDFLNNRPGSSSLSSVHNMVESARMRQGNQIILLDNGDLIQGTPAAYFANFVQDAPLNLFSRVMNMMKYDAATIGNHDIEAGAQVYMRLKDEFNFPWLGANILNSESGRPAFEPYTIINRQGLRIAVLGLTTPSVPNWLPPHLWEGLIFEDMVETARYWIPHIQQNERPDAIIGLFHSGFGRMDAGPSDHPLEQASAYIARNVPGFDVIFTGHDHRLRSERITNTEGREVLVMGPGHFAENLAVAELVFRRQDRRAHILQDVRGEMVPMNQVPPHHLFVQAFEKDVDEILAYSNKTVGHLLNDLNSAESLFGPSRFTGLVHKLQREISNADISFTAPLALDAHILAGPLMMRDFFRLYQYENYLYTMELSGREIHDYLEFSYSLWLNHMQDMDDNLLLFRRNEQGQAEVRPDGRFRLRHPFYNFDSADGIRYTVNAGKPVGERVHIISMEDGSSFEMEKQYKVAINSYRGSGGGGHLTQGAGIPHAELSSRITDTTRTDLRSALIRYFEEHGGVEAPLNDNWKIIPETWVEGARRRDSEHLGL